MSEVIEKTDVKVLLKDILKELVQIRQDICELEQDIENAKSWIQQEDQYEKHEDLNIYCLKKNKQDICGNCFSQGRRSILREKNSLMKCCCYCGQEFDLPSFDRSKLISEHYLPR